ncbi:hypothetical protein [Streptomyces qinzhouensis]|uniref:Uncharacterized protein n=1 Tax=Streptomyces qinzhouensis TaxID=2599401 RepID=A0A5B8JA35_9ACTN|nr:hypothetical protein [Streptomyces qinzhouensis]QDY78186.1 hypothetical protein FQU76_18710 [Streptomyces qinzhouensis]
MSFRHEESGTDAAIYRKPLGSEVIADATDPRAHQVLRECGFTENSVPPLYVWHELPEGLSVEEERSRSTRATVLLRAAGFDAELDPGLFSEAAYRTVLTEVRTSRTERSAAATATSPAATTRAPAVPEPTAPAVVRPATTVASSSSVSRRR